VGSLIDKIIYNEESEDIDVDTVIEELVTESLKKETNEID